MYDPYAAASNSASQSGSQGAPAAGEVLWVARHSAVQLCHFCGTLYEVMPNLFRGILEMDTFYHWTLDA